MSRQRGGTVTAPPPGLQPGTNLQPTSNGKERQFIGWLNDEQDVRSGSSSGAKSLTDITLKKDKDLADERREAALNEIDMAQSRLDLLTTQGVTVPSTATDAIKLARRLTWEDLAVPVKNEKLLKQLATVRAEISKAAKAIKPGADVLLDEIVRIEKSTNFGVADRLPPANSFTPKLNALKDLLKPGSVKPNIQQGLADAKALSKACETVVRDHSALQAEITTAEGEITTKSTEADRQCKKQPQAGSYCGQLLAKAREILIKARELEPAMPTNLTDVGAITSAITKYQSDVRAQIQLARAEANKVTTFLSQLSTATTPEDKSKIGRLLNIKQYVEDYYDTAVAMGFAPASGSPTKNDVNTWAANPTTATAPNIEKAATLATAIREFLDKKADEWDKAKDKAGPLLRFGQKLLAATAVNENEELSDVDSRSDEAKENQDEARWSLDQYDDALAAAKKRDYVTAVEALKKATDGEGSHPGLAELQRLAAEAFQSATVSEKQIKERGDAFGAVLGKMTTKSKIRLDEDALALMMGTGLTVDEEGDIAMSDQLKEMQRILEEGLKVWRPLVDKGMDPYKAADKAFAGIPENFWPPEAIRVIAMFRRAEAEFAAERENEELDAELRSGTMARLTKKAIDKVDGILEGKLGSVAETGNSIVTELAEKTEEVNDSVLEGIVEFVINKKPEFENLSDDDKLEKAKEFAKNNKVDLGAASDALGKLNLSLGVINGSFGMLSNAKDIVKAQLDISDYDPEKDSPVKLKIAQFERMRAIWHLLDSMADTILSALGPVTEAVPGLSLGGDIKSLAINAAEAAAYFKRLIEVRSLKSDAKYDPETMAELSLANEAHKLGLLSSEKTFEAAMAVLKIAGGAAELGGISAPAGWGLKAGTTIIQYSGKAFFSIYKWNDRRVAIKVLMVAKADPTNVNKVELVFEKCTMYSRFALADGALNGDTWCRRYILSRGLTDGDLDNVNTSTAILREYLNVTFQTKMGDAEEDDDLGQTKALEKKKKLAPSEEQYLSGWEADNVDPDPTAFGQNYQAAVAGGLRPDKQAHKAVTQALTEYGTAKQAAQDAIDAFNPAYDEFENALGTPNENAKATEAKKLLEAAVTAAAEAANNVTYVKVALATFPALATERDGEKKHKQHAGMQIYLQQLAQAVELDYQPIGDFRDEVSKKAMALEVRKKTDDEGFVEAAQQQFEALLQQSKQEAEAVRKQVQDAFAEGWPKLILSPKCVKKGTLTQITAAAAEAFELTKSEVDNKLAAPVARVRQMAEQSALMKAYGITGQALNEQKAAASITDQRKQQKELTKINTRKDKAIQHEAVQFWLDKSKVFLVKEIEAAIDELVQAKASGGGTPTEAFFDYDNDVSVDFGLTRAYWVAAKTVMQEKGWKFRKTGIGPALEAFEWAWSKVELLPKDSKVQAAWNESYGKLLSKINGLPLDREDGIELPGGKALKAALLKKLQEKKNEYEGKLGSKDEEQPPIQGDWVLSDGKLQKWPATEEGWLLMHELCTKHGWEGHQDQNKFARLFRKLDEAPGEDDPAAAYREAATELQKKLKDWKPNKKMLRSRKEHPGIMAYQRVMLSRLNAFATNTTATKL
jgi:hypothetical protein